MTLWLMQFEERGTVVAMKGEKLWAVIPTPRFVRYVALFCWIISLLHLIPFIFYHRPIGPYWEKRGLDFLVITTLCFCAWLSRTFVTTNNEGVRIRGFTRHQFIPWKDIDEFDVSEDSVTLRVHFVVHPIVIEMHRLKESPAFIELIQTQMVKAKDIECLCCGALISGDSEQCNECGWTWRQEAADSRTERDVHP